jgi:PAS domain S-box-containing protein
MPKDRMEKKSYLILYICATFVVFISYYFFNDGTNSMLVVLVHLVLLSFLSYFFYKNTTKVDEEVDQDPLENGIPAIQDEDTIEEDSSILPQEILANLNFPVFAFDLDSSEFVFSNANFDERFCHSPKEKSCFLNDDNTDPKCQFCKNIIFSKNFSRDLKWEAFVGMLGKYYQLNERILEIDGRRIKLVVAYDISEFKSIEKELKASLLKNEYQQKALDASSLVDIANRDGEIIYVNDKFCNVLGYSRSDIIGKSYKTIQSNLHSNEFFQKMWTTIENGKIWKGVLANKKLSGGVVWLDTTIVPILNENGEPIEFIAVRYDITKIKEAENELKKLESAIEFSPSSIVITNTKGEIEYVNRKFTEVTGYSYEEALNQNPRILKSDFYDHNHYKSMWETLNSGKVWQGLFKNRRKNGEAFWENASIAPIFDSEDNITHYVAVKEDISSKRDAEEALEKSNSLFRAAMDAIIEGFISYDNDGVVTAYNPRFLELWDIDPINTKLDEQVDVFKALITRITGRVEIFSRMQSNMNDDDASYEEDVKLRSGKVLNMFSNPQLNSDGQVIGRVWSFTDITRRIESEKLLLEYTHTLESVTEELDSEQKKLSNTVNDLEIAKDQAESATKAKSEFLANISHEIRTPLNSILGFTQLLQKSIKDEEQISQLNSIKASGKSLLLLINDILDLSKIEANRLELKYENINIKVLLDEIKSIFSINATNKGIDLILELSKDLPTMLVTDEIRIRQIMFNLIGNAIKFTSTGSVWIKCSAANKDEINHTTSVEFVIQDTGIGIKPDQIEDIFESFRQQSGQSAKKYGGTGLGLAITKRLVEMLGGTIEVESEVNNGSSFKVILDDVQYYEDEIILKEDEEKYKFKKIALFRREPDELLEIEKILLDYSMYEYNSKENGIPCMENDGIEIILFDLRIPIEEVQKYIDDIRSSERLNDTLVGGITDKDISELSSAMIDKFDGIVDSSSNSHSFDLMIRNFEQLNNQENTMEIAPTSSSNINFDCEKEKIVIAIVENLDEIHSEWESSKRSGMLDKIKAFAQNISDIGNIHEIESFKKFGCDLKSQAENFDFEAFPITLDSFSIVFTYFDKNEMNK